MKTKQEVKDIVDEEGLGYAIQSYLKIMWLLEEVDDEE